MLCVVFQVQTTVSSQIVIYSHIMMGSQLLSHKKRQSNKTSVNSMATQKTDLAILYAPLSRLGSNEVWYQYMENNRTSYTAHNCKENGLETAVRIQMGQIFVDVNVSICIHLQNDEYEIYLLLLNKCLSYSIHFVQKLFLLQVFLIPR